MTVGLVVLRLQLEVALGVVADGTHARGVLAYHNMTAVAAPPHAVAFAGVDQAAFDVGEELAVALFVLALDGAHHLELPGNLFEALLASLSGHAGIHVGPFEVLACGSLGQVLNRGGHFAAVEVFEPNLGMLLFVRG